MCRLAAWIGQPKAIEDVVIRPSHSLLEQSQDATEAKLAVNGDGFGIAWYADGRGPGLYRDVLPAWSDGNLTSLCQMIRAPIFLAHVRASTVGETSRVNCHPFRYGRWTFMHNGQIGCFARIRRHLESLLPDALYDARGGSTDSEMMFLLLLAHGLETDAGRAIAHVLALLAELRRPDDPPNRITSVLSDGQTLLAFRYASDAKAPTLYQRRGEEGITLASEPLDGESSGWASIKPQQLLRADFGGSILLPLDADRTAA